MKSKKEMVKEIDLKSSLDRFIVVLSVSIIISPSHLKSSLDRFIVGVEKVLQNTL